MNLTKVCNNVAAKALGEPGTIVNHVEYGHCYRKAFTVTGVDVDKGKLNIQDYGLYDATRFKKATE